MSQKTVPFKYRRLPGKRRGFYRRCTLWMGEDHLLAVDSNFYQERYRRYYFQDIQAFVSQRTSRRRAIGLTLLAIGLLPLIGAAIAFFFDNGGVALGFSLAAAPLFILILLNHLRGPTCVCHLQMPLGVQELPSLRRQRDAGKVLTRIGPLLEKAQGRLAREDIAARTRPPAGAGTVSPAPFAPRPSPAAPLSSYAGGIHRILFPVLLLEAGLTLWQTFNPGIVLYGIALVLALFLFVLLLTALVKQRGARLPGAASGLTWTALANFVACHFLGSAFFMIYFLINDPTVLAGVGEQVRAMAALKPADHPFLFGLNLLYAGVSACTGLLGLLALLSKGRGGRPGTA